MSVFYVFEGESNGITEEIKIDFNETNYAISPIVTSGASPSITFNNFVPNIPEGTILAEYTVGTDLIKLYFSKFFPFAYSEISEAPDPVIPVTPISLSVLVTDQTAVNTPTGSAQIGTTGGSPPYQYSIDGINYQVSNIFLNLFDGNYNVFVKDSEDAIQTKDFVIMPAVDPPSPPATPPTKDIIALSGAEIEIQNAYKRVRVLSKFGKAPSVITNGDFEIYDGQNWDYWTKYGNINVSRVQRTVTNSLGVQVPIENYALRFNEKAQQSRYVEHDAIPVQKGDTLKIDYRVGKTEGTGITAGVYRVVPFGEVPATYSVYYISKIRIKCGNFYLYNADYGNNYTWVNQVATVSHRVDNPQGDLSNYLVNFNIPECPITGGLIIQFFGFNKIQDITPINPFEALGESKELNEYSPIDIDNISASKSSQNTDNDIEGILSISDNLRFYSQIPETKEILFGDLFYRKDYQQPLDNLYTIKYNGQYTTGWYEYLGGSSKTLPFGMGLAKSILTAYQKPFRKWAGDLLLSETATRGFNYLDIISFNVPNSPSFSRKQFAFLGGQINLKTRQFENVSLVEIFDKDARSNDNTVPAYPDMPDPVFEQDPNSTIGNGIFTNEFTQEFN